MRIWLGNFFLALFFLTPPYLIHPFDDLKFYLIEKEGIIFSTTKNMGREQFLVCEMETFL